MFLSYGCFNSFNAVCFYFTSFLIEVLFLNITYFRSLFEIHNYINSEEENGVD